MSGRVQGVGYRNFARHHARKLGITGMAVNLEDARVEVQAEGTPESLAEFERLLLRGPSLARVTDLRAGPLADGPAFMDFITR